MVEPHVLVSDVDSSVNIVSPFWDSVIETRFVQRKDDTAIVYLSSSNGCDLACRFCHLTKTKQTKTDRLGVEHYIAAVQRILSEIFVVRKGHSDPSLIQNLHFNFMARGEPLSNPNFVLYTREIFKGLRDLAESHLPGVKVFFKISSIFPKDIFIPDSLYVNGYEIRSGVVNPILRLRKELGVDIEFYYSIYSLDHTFRKRWIPKALDPNIVGRAFENRSDGIRLHHALIAGQNDSVQSAEAIVAWLEKFNISTMFNQVRYNPFGRNTGEESPPESVELYLNKFAQSKNITLVQQIPRVGKDIMASCGMFFS